MTLLKHGVAAAITMAGALAFSGVAIASSAGFIDNGHYTTDINNGLDWLDVTISVNQSYNYVSSQLGAGGVYEGWRYATGIEFNQMVSSWTGSAIANTFYGLVHHPEGVIDQLHFLLGSTIDAREIAQNGVTYDSRFGHDEGEHYDETHGMIADTSAHPGTHWTAIIVDNDRNTLDPDTSTTHELRIKTTSTRGGLGSYLVRDTLAPVPVPAAVWLMGSGLLGLLGYSRHRKPTIAA